MIQSLRNKFIETTGQTNSTYNVVVVVQEFLFSFLLMKLRWQILLL